MMEYRVRSRRSDEWANKYKGAQVNPEMVQLKIESACRIFKPDGNLLCVYLPGAVKELGDTMYADFSRIRMMTNNRGYASGSKRVSKTTGTRTGSAPINSAILGSIEMNARNMARSDDNVRPVCRLTAFTAQQVEEWDTLLPMFKRIAELFEENVPDRYAVQAGEAERTHDEWVIKGTPFTTITVNNTYPTGIHTDKGDLDAGFSTLVAMRRGNYVGGWLTFPQFGIAADMQDGDLLLMDAHEWHGNTPLLCAYCNEKLRKPDHKCEGMAEGEHSPERVSIVSYFRTKMAECGTAEEEGARRAAAAEAGAAKALGL